MGSNDVTDLNLRLKISRISLPCISLFFETIFSEVSVLTRRTGVEILLDFLTSDYLNFVVSI